MEFSEHEQRHEGIDTQPMSKGSADAEAEGSTSELDSGYAETVWLDCWPEGLLGHKGDDDGVVCVGDAASAGSAG